MKIVVVGLGYVGLSNAVLLAQNNEVIGIDISIDRVNMINLKQSPIDDIELTKYIEKKSLNLSASNAIDEVISGTDYVIICTPTDYNSKNNYFDTTLVEKVIEQVCTLEPNACIVIKSTIPMGFTDFIRAKYQTESVIFSPEFLREGRALHDNLYPSRIIIGDKSEKAVIFADLLKEGALKENIDVLFTGSREAEAIKLFSNTYLAMRVSFFNELDSYALASNLSSLEIIRGVSLDPRIGNDYNNPSFGYGGYCLPKDTKQLLANYNDVPQQVIKAIITSNDTRKDYLVEYILKNTPKVVGVHRLIMKAGSDNFRDSAIRGIIERIHLKKTAIIIYEPGINEEFYEGCKIENNLDIFKQQSDIIVANRFSQELNDVRNKVFTRDLFGSD